MKKKIKGWKNALLFFGAYFIVNLLSSAIGTTITAIFNIQDLHIAVYYLVKSVDLMLLLILTYYFTKKVSNEDFINLGFHKENLIKNSLTGIILGFSLISIIFLYYWYFDYLSLRGISFKFNNIIFTAIFWFYVGCIEEIVFRGYLLKNLMKSLNKYISVIIISLLFAVVHLANPNMNFIGFINLICFGMFVGLYYIEKKDLWFPIFIHFSWNFFKGSVFGLNVSGMSEFDSVVNINMMSNNKLITGGGVGAEGSLLTTALLVISIVIMEWIFQSRE